MAFSFPQTNFCSARVIFADIQNVNWNKMKKVIPPVW